MNKKNENRDKLRSVFLDPGVDTKREIVEFAGVKIEIREPTRKEQRKIYKKAGLKAGVDKDGNPKMEFDIEFVEKIKTMSAIFLCFDPESGKRIFEESDIEVLDNLPASSEFGKLADKALEFVKSDVKEVEKN